MEPSPGITVTPSVRLVRKLGVGGMGSVWVADHLGLGTTVAVKFISPEVVRARPVLLERFKREAGIAARIKSPHVVQVFDHGLTDDETPYIVMELLEGESLRERLRREGPVEVRHAAMLVAQVAQVLSKAHKVGIIHRDIKPANVFLAQTEYELFVKVLDFGIAKQEELDGDPSATSSGLVMGSPLYMSPEQFLSARDVDHRADLWSLAVVAYQALVGRPPFAGDTPGRVMRAEIERRDYQPPSALRSELGTMFDRWFARAFARDIGERYQSAEELSRTFLTLCGEHTGVTSGALASTGPSIEELAGHSSYEPDPTPLPLISAATGDSASSGSGAARSRSLGGVELRSPEPDQTAGTEVDGPPTLEDDRSGPPSGSEPRPPAPASSTMPSAGWRFRRARHTAVLAVVGIGLGGALMLGRALWRDDTASSSSDDGSTLPSGAGSASPLTGSEGTAPAVDGSTGTAVPPAPSSSVEPASRPLTDSSTEPPVATAPPAGSPTAAAKATSGRPPSTPSSRPSAAPSASAPAPIPTEPDYGF